MNNKEVIASSYPYQLPPRDSAARVAVEDGTESHFPELKQTTLRMIQSQGGIVGWVTTANRLTDYLRHAYG